MATEPRTTCCDNAEDDQLSVGRRYLASLWLLEPPAFLRYATAVLSVIVAFRALLWMDVSLQAAAHVSVFLCAILFSVWFGGMGPGVLAGLLSVLAFAYYLLPPTHSLNLNSNEWPRLVLFIVLAFIVGTLAVVQRRAAESLAQAHDDLKKDIIARNDAEEALRQSEERFAAFMDNLPGFAWMKDLQGRYVYVNEMVRGLPGYRSLGKTDAQIWPGDLAAEYRANDELVIAAKKPLDTLEHYQLKGKQRYMAGSKFPIFDKTGAVALVGGAGVDITERIEAEEALRAAHQQLRALSRRRVQIQEEERRHLARELHDKIGQLVTAAKINVQSVRSSTDDRRASEKLAQTTAILEDVLEQARQISFALRPPVLDDLGLAPALRWMLSETARTAGIGAEFIADRDLRRADPESETACYRVAVEAVTNAIRYADAHKISIELRNADGRVRLKISDNGHGFDVAKVERAPERDRLGISGMRERTFAVGGQFKIRSEPGKGTEVIADFPLSSAPDSVA